MDIPARKTGTDVQLMATCLCDAFYAEAAKATVKVLEHAGCRVEFPEGQTCCGQPAFNSGDWDASRKVFRHTMNVFRGEKPVVVPSGSCAAMLFHGSSLQFEGEADAGQAEELAGRTWELCDFLVNGLGMEEWGGRLNAGIAVHHSCHTRGTGSGKAMEKLLQSIEGVNLLSISEPGQCCGFGGTFAVTFPHISKEMGQLKIDDLLGGRPDIIVSGDMSCIMHQAGLAGKQGRSYPARHIAEVLVESIAGK